MKDYIQLETVVIKPNLVVVASWSTTFSNLQLRNNPPMTLQEAKLLMERAREEFKKAGKRFNGSVKLMEEIKSLAGGAKREYAQYLASFKTAYEFWNGLDLSKGLDRDIDLTDFYQLRNNIYAAWYKTTALGRYVYITDDLVRYRA